MLFDIDVYCDDGNLISNDGCSSECLVEDGFTCFYEQGAPDNCIELFLPAATIGNITSTNLLLLEFNRVIEPIAIVIPEEAS